MTAAGGVAYSYDNNGNQTARGSDTYTWDAHNRLTQATVGGTLAMYQYRGDNLRHNKWVGGVNTMYTWDVQGWDYYKRKGGGLPVILQDGTLTYVYGYNLISQTDGSGTQTYFLTNALGSTEALTDASGTVTGTRKYDVFGAVRSSTGSASSEYLFTGQQQDATLGYTYLRARYYDPAVGRFISKDAFPAFAGRSQSINRYTYVNNNSVNRTDPRGAFGPDVLADLAFIAWDILQLVLDVVEEATGGDSDLGDDLAALGLDTGSAFLPGVTGAGMVYRAGKAASRAADAINHIPGNPFRGADAAERAYEHLKNFHGIDPNVASERLHTIKDKAGLGADDAVAIGRTGDVYDGTYR